MLNAEFVREIGKNAVEAASVQVLPPVPSENGRFIRIYDRETKDVRTIRTERAPRRDIVQRIEDVVSLVNRRLGADTELCGEVFVGDDRIVGVLEDADLNRDDTVTMQLHVNPAFEKVMELAQAEEVEWMSHGAFIELLRVDMAGCVNLLDFKTFKSLKFSANTSGSSNIKTGNESMDKSIQLGTFTEGGVEIPENIEFALPVYDECATVEKATGGDVVELRRWRVTCAIAVDTINQKFAIRPMTDELERARREAKQWLIGKLQGVAKGVLVITGAPSA